MGITSKLLLINSLICAAFIVIIMVVFFSFRHVKNELTTSFSSETHRIIENSNITRELSRILSDMNLILNTFYENDDVLAVKGPHLSHEVEVLLASSGNSEMNHSLSRFKEHLRMILDLSEQVNLIRRKIKTLHEEFESTLISLDHIVAERLVELIVQGESILDLEQLSRMIGGWRESFIRMKLQFVRLGLDHFMEEEENTNHPVLTLADDLQLRLRTLTASEPAISEHGKALIQLLTVYKASILTFHQRAKSLGELLEKNSREKEGLLLMMEKADKSILKKTEDATAALTDLIDTSMGVNLFIFLSILPMVLLGGMTAYSIKRPIGKVIETIRRLSKGDLPEVIQEGYKGEFEQVKEYLNLLIRATDNVTQVAEDIVGGNTVILVQERSVNDRLMQALNRMIQRVDSIIHETRRIIQSVGEGRMDVRGNADAFEGGWQELVSGINDLIEALSHEVSTSAALNQEMALARDIQTCLLPPSVTTIHPEFEIAAGMLPADEVGGDFYDITQDSAGHLRLAIGDVSGHGVTPGLIMMMAQAVHACVIHNVDNDTREAVMKVNHILYDNVHERLKETHFMTFNALKYLGDGRFEHAGAHLRIILYRRESKACELIRTNGVYLNFKRDISKSIKNSYFQLAKNDIMILYTDGLTEAQNSKGELLDIERFVKIIETHARHDFSLESMKERILADVLAWCHHKREDDMTLVIVKRKGGEDG